MENKSLHIITFDYPFPANYGGAIESFFKIKSLSEIGYKIYLHCFVTTIPNDSELEKYTEEIYFYEKKRQLLYFFSFIPFSVVSRRDKKLIENLLKTDAPILFDGLQSSCVFKQFGNQLKNNCYLRLHNVESHYYYGLFKSENNIFRKTAYFLESVKYKKYQNIIKKFNAVFTLSRFETDFVGSHYKEAIFVPVFHGNDGVSILSEYGNYAFYNGDLRISDNRKAALFLIEIFKKIPEYKLVIASGIQDKTIENSCKSIPNIEFIQIKNQGHLEELFSLSHINVMLSFQQSGTKLKTINALFKGRHCIVNKNMVDDEKILSLCIVAETQNDFINAVNELRNKPFIDSQNRKSIMESVFDNQKNALKISGIIENTTPFSAPLQK